MHAIIEAIRSAEDPKAANVTEADMRRLINRLTSDPQAGELIIGSVLLTDQAAEARPVDLDLALGAEACLIGRHRLTQPVRQHKGRLRIAVPGTQYQTKPANDSLNKSFQLIVLPACSTSLSPRLAAEEPPVLS